MKSQFTFSTRHEFYKGDSVDQKNLKKIFISSLIAKRSDKARKRQQVVFAVPLSEGYSGRNKNLFHMYFMYLCKKE